MGRPPENFAAESANAIPIYSRSLRYFRLSAAAKDVARLIFELGPESLNNPQDEVRLRSQRYLAMECSLSEKWVSMALAELERAKIIVRDHRARGPLTITVNPPFTGWPECRVQWCAPRASVLYAADLTLYQAVHGQQPMQRLARSVNAEAAAQGQLLDASMGRDAAVAAELAVDRGGRPATARQPQARRPVPVEEGEATAIPTSCDDEHPDSSGRFSSLSSGSFRSPETISPSPIRGRMGYGEGRGEPPDSSTSVTERFRAALGIEFGQWAEADLVAMAQKLFGRRCGVRLEGLINALGKEDRGACYEMLAQGLQQHKAIEVPHGWCVNVYGKIKRARAAKRAGSLDSAGVGT